MPNRLLIFKIAFIYLGVHVCVCRVSWCSHDKKAAVGWGTAHGLRSVHQPVMLSVCILAKQSGEASWSGSPSRGRSELHIYAFSTTWHAHSTSCVSCLHLFLAQNIQEIGLDLNLTPLHLRLGLTYEKSGRRRGFWVQAGASCSASLSSHCDCSLFTEGT